MKPKVYAPSIPSRFDASTRLWVPTMNLEPARKFGEVVELLPPGASRLAIAPLIVALNEKLADAKPEDWLVAIGDPSLIAAATIILYKRTGKLRLLKWDRMAGDYLPTETAL